LVAEAGFEPTTQRL